MGQTWPMKALGAMTADEARAALEQLTYLCPQDAALEKALRGQLAWAAEREGYTAARSGAPEPAG